MVLTGRVAVVLVISLFAVCQVNCDKSDDTCDVLLDIASATVAANCTTNGDEDCDTVLCNTVFRVPISYNITVLPCNKPPGLRISLTAAGTKALDGEVFTQSRNAPIAGGIATLVVTLDQLEDEHSIGVELQVMASSPLEVMITFVNYTKIPVECEDGGTAGAAGVSVEVLLFVLLSLIMAMWQLF